MCVLPLIANNYTVSNVSVEVGADGTFIGVAHLQVKLKGCNKYMCMQCV